jgi:glycyl-tRNA synthetase beta chain
MKNNKNIKKKNVKGPAAEENTLLLEIGVEEIPAGYLAPAALQLQEDAKRAIGEKNIAFKDARAWYTVRRFILEIDGIAQKQKDLSYEKKGPRHDIAYKNGKLTDIGKTFLQKNGVSEKDLKIKEEKGQKYLFLDIFEKGRPSKKVLSEIFPEIIKNLRFPKSMAWEGPHATFARPVRWILCMLGNEIVPFTFGPVVSGNKTRLRKFEDAGREAVIEDAGRYFALIKKAGIIISQEERKQEIIKKAGGLLSKKKLKMLSDEGLLDRIAGSVETVTAMLGEFDEKYLSLPHEVVITAMREHQRYFAVLSQSGRFTNYFVNIRDGGEKNNAFIAKQHAKVLFSRLNDAEFFYKEDLKTPLEKNIERLKEAVFITGLGTMYDKMERLKMLAARAKELFGYEDTTALQLAAYLSKADLMTNMVGEKEYAGLRGFMGGVYLEKQGREEKVWKAVSEHYFPNMAGDKLPSTREGLLLSMMDKMDNIAGFYIAGFKPTGSKDPYAVRRQALNIIYMVLEKTLDVDLALFIYEDALAYKNQLKKDTDISEIIEFFKQREINYFKDKGVDYDIINAVTAGNRLCITDDYKKARVIMEKKKAAKDFNDIIFAVSRVNNILPRGYKAGSTDRTIFDAPEENALYDKFLANRERIQSLLGAKAYAECFDNIAGFKPEIDRYFDKVLVNTGDAGKKGNRLNMLAEIRDSFFAFADFSKIVIDRE